MPTYDRVHLKSCLADAVRSAVENLRDDASTSHLLFHKSVSEGALYDTAYSYLEDGLVSCTCGAIPTERAVSGNDEAEIEVTYGLFDCVWATATPAQRATQRWADIDCRHPVLRRIREGMNAVMCQAHIQAYDTLSHRPTADQIASSASASSSGWPVYEWYGWTAETENDNADDRKNVYYLTITENGEEYAVIIHRTLPQADGSVKYPLAGSLAQSKIEKAKRIVDVLNRMGEEG